MLHHVNVTVTDADRSKRFYIDVLGLEVRDDFVLDDPEFGRGVGMPGARIRAVFMGFPGQDAFVEMLQYLPAGEPARRDPPSRAGLGHVAFRVDDIQAVYERLRDAGVEFVSSPVNTGGTRWCYFRDPDGNCLELIQPA